MRCGLKYGYFRAEIEFDDVKRVICGNCDPSVKFAVAYFNAIDPLVAVKDAPTLNR
jgi:hypothetical protein